MFSQKGAMKVLLDIPDKKVDLIMEFVRNIPHVKATPLTESKAELLSEIREAVHEVKQIKAGKQSSRNVWDFIRES
jgi:hypothetical protein